MPGCICGCLVAREDHTHIDIFGLTRSFAKNETPKYIGLDVFQGDIMHSHYKVVNFRDTVKSVACVLPGCGPTVPFRESKTPNDFIKEKTFENLYYVSIPPQNLWWNLGWDMIDSKFDPSVSLDYDADSDASDSDSDEEMDAAEYTV